MSKKAIQHLCKDKKLKKAIGEVKELPAPRSTGDLYYDLVRTIAFQQLSGKAATTIFNRFLELFDDAYPHPQLVLEFDVKDFRAVGFSYRKSSYIQNIAQFFLDNNLMKKDWAKDTDEELIKHLTEIKGVGKWTVQMILMFTLERPDVFPVDDLGIQQGIAKLYDLEETGKELKKRMVEIATAWQPYRTLASRYIWYWKDNNATM